MGWDFVFLVQFFIWFLVCFFVCLLFPLFYCFFQPYFSEIFILCTLYLIAQFVYYFVFILFCCSWVCCDEKLYAYLKKKSNEKKKKTLWNIFTFLLRNMDSRKQQIIITITDPLLHFRLVKLLEIWTAGKHY